MFSRSRFNFIQIQCTNFIHLFIFFLLVIAQKLHCRLSLETRLSPDCDFKKIRKVYGCHNNMPQPSCMCTVLLKLAKVEWLKIRKLGVQVLLITKGW